VDITVLVEFGDEALAAEKLLKVLHARIPDAAAFSIRSRVLLAQDSLGTPVDVAFGAMPFEVRAVERASYFDVEPFRLRTCSAEDLIVHKTFAGRPQDWIDVDSILARQKVLDWSLIEQELRPLLELKETPQTWDALIARRK
jgi:hypothetical protein